MSVELALRELLDGCRPESLSSGSLHFPLSGLFDSLISDTDLSRSTTTSSIFWVAGDFDEERKILLYIRAQVRFDVIASLIANSFADSEKKT